MNKKNIFYISDLHFDHKNVIKFDNRPFKNVDEMNQKLITLWNEEVRKCDTVYILGDFCWGKTERWIELLNILKGQKILIRGNHDLKQYSAELKSKFSDIKEYKEINDNGRHVILSHYPIPCYNHDYNNKYFMLYGHVHQTKEYDLINKYKENTNIIYANEKYRPITNNLINVGCMLDYMDYRPRTLDYLISKNKGDDDNE